MLIAKVALLSRFIFVMAEIKQFLKLNITKQPIFVFMQIMLIEYFYCKNVLVGHVYEDSVKQYNVQLIINIYSEPVFK